MKRVLILIIGLSLFLNSYSQEYPKVKVTLENGLTLTGKYGYLTPDSVSFVTDGAYYCFSLDTVRFVNAKKGKGKKIAGYVAGGCLGLSLGVFVASGGQTIDSDGETTSIDPGEYIVSTLLWTGLFAGVGCLIGTLIDDWELVYLQNSHSSIIKNTKLNLAADPQGNVMLKLRYSF